MNPSFLNHIAYPVILAPMLGVVTPAMVAEVSELGGLGSLPLGGLSAEASRKLIRETKQLTQKDFAVNLFANAAPDLESNRAATEKMSNFIRCILKEKNWAQDFEFNYQFYPYQDLIDLIIEEQVKYVSFTFGMLDKESIEKLEKHHIYTIGTATCTDEAVLLEQSGVDAIVAQGIEAGGHRGSFLYEKCIPQVGLFTLVSQIKDTVKVPVIASGGIYDCKTMAAAFSLGADAVQIGSYFISAEESAATDVYRNLLKSSTDVSTTLTKSYTGRWARGIRNDFMKLTEINHLQIPDYPIQNILTQNMRALAKQHHDAQFTNYWAGQNARYAKHLPTRDIMNELIAIYKTII
ncbi:2-nitropropane dioxygenase [Elizabethkingia meningoseptica]|uniref:NAD(P)H-dependent flavin oxidoreductase n=1 Tax=Elizabethkingia meningoseptica TaxID=238 RepID=UPI000332BEF1|nr:nitronate monooxygenase [Elizabethkingia meningoseptica]AQX06639.1 2-nitropropane dioxygenase [Elizabethkingia meningoseptica]AQX48687.1 2-nitropropane dioxygenase [Elizabethkingia meningoseptica]EOR28424.1 2-nitropropane dioxygenase [Elizabethkingia meningoseptica ATCC 13253 = NBRC 12535]KUY22392.1 2-nitropropane dioxygenase [Elizabethkingia meningoseptica]MDE5488216.1 nitronate monooxygenase [Elizabethkingia meningoseptica]